MRETLLAVATVFLLVAWTPFPTAVGPEVPLDAPAPARMTGTLPFLATDGNGALLLSVYATVSRPEWPGRFYMVGALDERAAPAAESQFLDNIFSVSAASSGRGYLVTYRDGNRIYALRYNNRGTRLTEEPILLGTSSVVSEVTWDGTAYVVVVGGDALSIAEDGRILGKRDVPALTGGIETASRNGVTVLVNHGDDSGIAGPLVAHAIGGASHDLGSGVSTDVAAGDPGFLVTYGLGDGNIYGQLLDPSGAPDGEPFEIASGEKPAAAWNGSEWLVVYEANYSSTRAVRVLRGPVAPSFELDATSHNPAVAAKDGKVFVAWDHQLPTTSELRSATIDGEDVTVNEGLAGFFSTAQTQPMLAVVDGASLLTWYDGGGLRIRRMDGRSAVQTVTGVGHPLGFAAGGDQALVVTRGPGAVFFTRVDREGKVLSQQQTKWNFNIDFGAAAWTGDRWMAVWLDRGVIGTQRLVRAVVYADGTVETPRRFGASVTTPTRGLNVVAAGSNAMVLWSVDGNGGGRTLTFTIDGNSVARPGRDLDQRMFTAASRGEDVLTGNVLGDSLTWNRVLPDGTVAASGRIALPAEGMTLQTFVSGENYLLLLAKKETAPDRLDLYGVRFDANGTPIDAEPVRFASAFTTLPPTFAGAVLRGNTIDLTYFRALDEAGLFYEYPRLVFRSVHDAPRRRVLR